MRGFLYKDMGIKLNSKKRSFLPLTISLENWEDIKSFYEELQQRQINSAEDQHTWLADRSEIDAFVSEDLAWRYIKFTCNTLDEDIKKRYDYFINEIQPHLAPISDQLNRKFIDFYNVESAPSEAYQILYRSIKNSIELFREKNIPLYTTIANEGQKYARITSKMMIEHEGAELTLQQAAAFLENPDREIRKQVFDKVVDARLKDAAEIDELYSTLVKLRQEVAENASFSNFRDYKFIDLDRFDYSIEDNLEFHNSIRDEIVPLIKLIQERRLNLMDVKELRPYDNDAPIPGELRITAFEQVDELVDKTITGFNNLGFNLGEYIGIMKSNGFLDLDSRKGKAPGGYNYPLAETGIPFIFMNATGRQRDLVTMMHEGGHAIHSFVSRDLELTYFKHTPSEVAELASMSMELISMDQWKVFYKDEKEFKQAVHKHLEDILMVLPWVAIIDKFQHWVYTHPTHSITERDEEWMSILKEFGTGIVNYDGYEEYLKKSWQKQLHLFEIPFYYIEYAIAQLGAIAVWKNYKQNKEQGLNSYMEALKLGYTKSIPEIYKTAGINFSFSKSHLKELANFVKEEIKKYE